MVFIGVIPVINWPHLHARGNRWLNDRSFPAYISMASGWAMDELAEVA